MFKTNERIIHLDLSNNNFSLDESKKISEGLKTNNSIYGFHFEGNYGYIDNRGFLNIDSKFKPSFEFFTNRRINGYFYFR